jgi:hypothetical protein
MLQQTLQKSKLPSRIVITFQVMAVSRVSPGNPYTVSTMAKGSQYELGVNPGRTRHPDHSEVGRILQTAYSGKIGSTVAAPVAKKSCDDGFPITHGSLLWDGPSVSCLEMQI